MSKGGPIWPGAKSTPGKIKEADQAFSTHKEVSAPGVQSSQKPGLDGQVAKTPAAPPKTPAQISKSMSPKDIYQQLGNILKNEPLSQDNKQIALLMATHGVEISEDSFGLVKKLLKGKKISFS